MKLRCMGSWVVLGSLAVAGVSWASPDPPPTSADRTGTWTTNRVLRLEDALGIAMARHPGLRAGVARVDAATGRAQQSALWPNPELTLSAEDWPVHGGDFSDAKQLIGVEQSIPFPGKKRLDRGIGQSGVKAAEAELRGRAIDLGREVRGVYFQVLASEQSLAVARELVSVAESFAATAARRVAAGAAPDQEQIRAEIPLEQARTVVSGLEADRANARGMLALLLGGPEFKEARLEGTLPEAIDSARYDATPETWLARHPSLVAAKTGHDRAELEFRRARLEPYPDMKLGIAGGRDATPGGSIVQVGVSFPLPIIDRSKGRQQEARGNADAAEAEVLVVEQRLLHAWESARARLRAATEQVRVYRERILPRADEALRLVQAGFEAGKFGFVDLLETQRTTAESRLAYQQRLLELNLAQADLEALIGTPPPVPADNSARPGPVSR